MDNINTILADNIQKFRKEKQMTQEELADKIGVTYQAISKWENAKSTPDIAFLPILADLFGCSIDTLFSHNAVKENTVNYNTICNDLPWKDDDVIRGVVCHGRRILLAKTDLDELKTFTFELVGDTKKVKSECNLTVKGNVNGGCNARDSITVDGGVNGGLNCGANISIGGNISGGINSGANVSCSGNVNGAINCSASIACHNIEANGINCGGSIAADGDIKADTLKMKCGKIQCLKFHCETVKGVVNIKTNE